MSHAIISNNDFDDQDVEDVALLLLGNHVFLGKDAKSAEDEAKNRAKYKMKKNPAFRERVIEYIENAKDEWDDHLGGIDAHEIMDETFPSGW